MKELRFRHELVPLALSGEKTSTWRLWDDKAISVGDVIACVDFETGEVFACALVTDVVEKTLGSLTEDDRHRLLRKASRPRHTSQAHLVSPVALNDSMARDPTRLGPAARGLDTVEPEGAGSDPARAPVPGLRSRARSRMPNPT